MERFGIGTEVNESAAFLWYEKSAFQGYPNAILRMIEAYSNGIGISHNPVKAYAWHQIALAHGLQLPESMLPSQVKNISSEEMSEAESIIQNIQWEMAVNK